MIYEKIIPLVFGVGFLQTCILIFQNLNRFGVSGKFVIISLFHKKASIFLKNTTFEQNNIYFANLIRKMLNFYIPIKRQWLGVLAIY